MLCYLIIIDLDILDSDVICIIDVQLIVGFLENVIFFFGLEISNMGKCVVLFIIDDIEVGNLNYV